MESDPCHKAVEMKAVVGEILMRVGCTKSLFRSTLVSKLWLKTARSRPVFVGFALRNKPSFLGFMTERRGLDGDGFKLICPPGVPTNDSVLSMRAWFDISCLYRLYVLCSLGGRLICRMDVSGRVEHWICMLCPYANASKCTLLAPAVPSIEITAGQETVSSYGQFAILPPTDLIGSSPVVFFFRNSACWLISRPQGVIFKSGSSVYVHVQAFRNDIWIPKVFGPLAPPACAMFHNNPYCVQASSMVYIMYVVGYIVSFDTEQESFAVVDLPGGMADLVKSGLDYSVGTPSGGHLALVHASEGTLVKWVLCRNGNSAGWQKERTVDLLDAFTENFSGDSDMAARAGSAVQVRRVCPDTRFVLISIWFNQGLFVVDMLGRNVRKVQNVAVGEIVGRVFPLSENWPPMEPVEDEE